jgi:hypothetical protein
VRILGFLGAIYEKLLSREISSAKARKSACVGTQEPSSQFNEVNCGKKIGSRVD